MPSKWDWKPPQKKPLTTNNMADKTMPPADPMPAADLGAGQAPMQDMAPPAPQGGDSGSVMISMPKEAFDAIHQLISQLSSGFDNLAQSVGQQAGGAGEPPAPPEGGMPPQAPAGGMQSGGDDDFLKGIAQEGNARTK